MKKNRSIQIMKSKVMVLSLFLMLLLSSCAQNNKLDTNLDTNLDLPELIPYRKGELWGYCDKDKNIKIPCKYQYTELFDSFGFAKVYTLFSDLEYSQSVGLIDRMGKIVIPISKREAFNYLIVTKDVFDSIKQDNFDYVVNKGKIIVYTDKNNPDIKNIFTQSTMNNSNMKNYFLTDVFINPSRVLSLRGDTLFCIDKSGQELVVGNKILSYFMFGNVIYYKKYRHSLNLHWAGYNVKTKKHILDSLEVIPKNVFKFKDEIYLKVLKQKSWDLETGEVKYNVGVVDKDGKFVIPISYENVTYYNYYNNYIIARKGRIIDFYSFHLLKDLQRVYSLSLPNNAEIERLELDEGLILLVDLSKENGMIGYKNLNGTKYYE